jgi:hypothetical protein
MRKKKQQLSEKQLEAKRLFKDILSVTAVTLKGNYYREEWKRDVEKSILVCCVNNERYINVSSLPTYSSDSMIRSFCNQGLIAENEMAHWKYPKFVRTFIKASTLTRIESNLTEYVRKSVYGSVNELKCVLSMLNDKSLDVPNNEIDKDKLKESERIYYKRNQLIHEASDEREEERYQESVREFEAQQQQQSDGPAETMRMNIELADNGIILRNPDCLDEVTLAINGGGTHRENGYGYDIDHKPEYEAIGQKIYWWLMDVVCQEHADELIITNFDIDIKATCKGREKE